MTFFEKNEENLEALVYSLTEREKSTIVIGIYDCDDTADSAIAYVTKQLEGQKTLILDLYGLQIDSLLAFFWGNLPRKREDSFAIVHLKRFDSVLVKTQNHAVVSSHLVSQINMERELLFREVNSLAILWVTRDGYNRLRIEAPDFTDWVAASFVFEQVGANPAKTPPTPMKIALQNANGSYMGYVEGKSIADVRRLLDELLGTDTGELYGLQEYNGTGRPLKAQQLGMPSPERIAQISDLYQKLSIDGGRDKFDLAFPDSEKEELPDALLPCPHCGGKAHLSGRFPTGQYFAQCENCRVSLWADRRDKARGLWNNRVDHDPAAGVANLVPSADTKAMLGEELRGIRESISLSQTAFGKLLGGVPLRTVQNWEKGINNIPPTVPEILRLRGLLKK